MASIRKVSDFLKIVGQKVDLETKQNGRFCGKLYNISDSCKHLILHDVVHISPKGKPVHYDKQLISIIEVELIEVQNAGVSASSEPLKFETPENFHETQRILTKLEYKRNRFIGFLTFLSGIGIIALVIGVFILSGYFSGGQTFTIYIGVFILGLILIIAGIYSMFTGKSVNVFLAKHLK